MATLLDCTTFNCVMVWGGPGGQSTNTIVGSPSNIQSVYAASSTNNTVFGKDIANDVGSSFRNNSAMGFRMLKSAGGPGPSDCLYHNVVFGAFPMFIAQGDNHYNTVLGYESFFSLQPGSQHNIAIGLRAGKGLAAGRHNIFIGTQAANVASTASYNIGIGNGAMKNMGNQNFNIGIGSSALGGNSGGGRNIGIGFLSGYNVVNANDTISIGWNTTTSDNNGHTAIGGPSTSINKVGSNSWTNLSDSRDKSDIEELNNNLGLNFIRNLRPVKFNFDNRDLYVKECNFTYGTKDGTLKSEIETYGFIAQEIKQTVDDLQTHFDALSYDNSKDAYRLAYDNLISPIVKSLQQTIERLEYLESKV
jgi:hypothetical protein